VACARPWSARELFTGLGLLVLLSGLAQSSGGFFPSAWSIATLALLAMAAAGAVVVRHVDAGRLDATMVAALGALAVWTLLSAAWSVAPAATVLEAQRALLYVVAVAVLLTAARTGSGPIVLTTVLAACTAVCLYALARGGPGPLAAPLGYANALGAIAAVGFVLAAGFAIERHAAATQAPRPYIAPCSLALVALLPLAAVLWLSGSRAALIAAIVGLAAAVALRHGRRVAVLALVVAAASLGVGAWAAAGSLRAREPIWSVATHAAAAHPVLGVGAGGFDRVWWRERPVRRGAREAHSLYLETLAELGPLGVALLLAALAVPLVAALRARRAPLVPAAAGAYVTFLVHAGADWDWEMPAVTLAGLACAVAMLVAGRPPGRARSVTASARRAISAGLLVLALATCAGYSGNAALDRTHEAIAAGSLAAAGASAREAARWAPWSAAPWLVVGEAALRRGDLAIARASFRRGLARDAGDWELWAALARASRGDARRVALRRAAALNPLGAFRD